eukprot:scaffold201082_cov42-Prasinocladus_malaysianus.AAC.2
MSAHLVAANFDEVVAEDGPDPVPDQPDAVHVEVGDLHDLCEPKDAGVGRVGELLQADPAQRGHKVDNRHAVEPVAAHKEPVELLGVQHLRRPPPA